MALLLRVSTEIPSDWRRKAKATKEPTANAFMESKPVPPNLNMAQATAVMRAWSWNKSPVTKVASCNTSKDVRE
jgi:hypothetical protein